MIEVDLEDIEKIVQHTVKTVNHTTAPETRQLIGDLSEKFEEHKIDDLKIIRILEDQNKESVRYHTRIDAHMKRVEPVIQSFENRQLLSKSAERLGNRIAFWAKVISSLIVIAVALKYAIIILNIHV